MSAVDKGKPLATIQVDVDGLAVLLAHHGLPEHRERDTILLSALPRFVTLFARHQIKATFFVVARDLLDPEKQDLIRSLVEAGHEIGNHTMNHPTSLSAMDAVAQEREIVEAEELMVERLGVAPVGFRAPNFDIDERVMTMLNNRNYVYDSSVLPMPYGPLLRWCKQRISSTRRVRSHYLGRTAYGLAPLRPYLPAKFSIWRRGVNRMVEVPVTTMPFTRLPFHFSFNLAMRVWGGGNLLFRMGYACTNRLQIPLNYVFHACELADVPTDRRLEKHWGLFLPVEERIAVMDSLLAAVTRGYEVSPTWHFVQKVGIGKRIGGTS